MQNHFYQIEIDETTGGLNRLTFVNDPHQMNFCKAGRTISSVADFAVEKIEYAENKCVVYAKKGLSVLTTEYLLNGEYVEITHTLKNTARYPVYYKNADFAIQMPLNDNYRDGAAECMKHCCSTHIFAGNRSSYIRAERMGVSDYNLGMILREGEFSSYSQDGGKIWHSNRGYFILNTPAFRLLSGEEYKLAYTFFRYKDYPGFVAKLRSFDSYLHIENDGFYTVKKGGRVAFNVIAKENITSASCTVNGEEIDAEIDGNTLKISFIAKEYGEQAVEFTINGKRSYAKYFATIDEEELIKTRLYFIVEHQQCLEKDSPLYGAFLIYDNEEKRQFYNATVRDHNANRERMGMSILLAKWLQTHDDAFLRERLDLFVEFLCRESFEESTGEVFDGIGKDPDFLRLYNAPWTALFFTEMYNLTKDTRFARNVYKSLKYYYSVGGTKFYPNGIRFYEFFKVMKEALPQEQTQEILELFDQHVGNIVKNGIEYPPHEVRFEQTIVTPAVSIILDKYEISGDAYYLREAEKHLRILRKFDGCQPNYHTHNIPIRFWDNRWFGKSATYGDTFPHYWSILSGYNYFRYGKLTGNAEGVKVGLDCIRNNACLFEENGAAHCTYLMPFRVDGKRYECYDHFANDQDFALYFIWKVTLEEKQ